MPRCTLCGETYPPGELFCSQDGNPLLDDPIPKDKETPTPAPPGFTPGEIRRGAPLAKEIVVRGQTWRLVDMLKIGDKESERTHHLTFKWELNRIRLEGYFPSGLGLADDGVTHAGPLSFRFSRLNPNQDALFIFRVNAGAGITREVDLWIDGVRIPTRPPERDETFCWRHETLLVPKEHIGASEISVTRRPQEGFWANLFALWVYQEKQM